MSKIALLVALMAALGTFFVASRLIGAADSPSIALMGQVSSEKEGPMEGVLVGAKKDGSTITINVVSDDKGRYSFPIFQTGAWPLFPQNSRRGIRTGWPQDNRCCLRDSNNSGHQTPPNQESRLPIDQCGVGRERAWDR